MEDRSLRWALISTPDYENMSGTAAEFVCRFVRTHRDRIVVALPTGETPSLLYALLPRLLHHQAISESRFRFINLDEYVGFSNENPDSFACALRMQFLDKLVLEKEAVRLLDGAAIDSGAECERHEAWIRDAGGLDLAILGLGVNGHIAFNEPGTDFSSKTHVAVLAEWTRQRIQRSIQCKVCPSHAMTMGIGTILAARSIVLLASGSEKADALNRAFNRPTTASLPASVLQKHPCVTVIADVAALSEWDGPATYSSGVRTSGEEESRS
jgi:glucosamine-6-phosphate deaminase